MTDPAAGGDGEGGSADRRGEAGGRAGVERGGAGGERGGSGGERDGSGGERGRSGVRWLAGLLVVTALVYITVNTARTDAPGARGLPAGARLPPFAAPLATSGLPGDANVAVGRGGGGPPACGVRGRDVVNSCALGERGPVALAFVAVRPAECLDVIDALDAAAREHPRVGVAVVAIRGDRRELAGVVRRRGWRIPVAHDRDGAVSNTYGVGVCPTLFFADRGAVNRETAYGSLTAAQVSRRLGRLR